MPTLPRDLRRAARLLRGDPLVALASFLSLALGIGCATVLLSAGDAILLRPVPGTRGDGLVRVSGAGEGELSVLSHPEIEALREAPGVFRALASERTNTVPTVLAGAPRTLGAAAVSDGYFRVLDVPMALGRTFEDDPPGAPVAVISHALWQSAWGGDPHVLGRSLRAGGVEFSVVGVSGPGFRGALPGFVASVWFPLAHLETVFPGDGDSSRMDDRFLDAVGVLAPGVGTEEASSRLEAVAGRLRSRPGFGGRRSFQVTRARGVHLRLRTPAELLLVVLSLVAASVMAAACANVANLLLARGIERRGDHATRRMLGAGALDVARPVLVECATVAAAGTVGGLALAVGLTRWISALRPPLSVPLGLELEVRPGVALAAGGVGLGCAVLSGLLPVVSAIRADPGTRAGPAARSPAGRGSARRMLVAVQVAFTCVLLTAAALLVRSLGGVDGLDVGFDRKAVVTVDTDMASVPAEEADRLRDLLLRRIETLPWVEGVAAGQFVHLGDRADRMEVASAGDAPGTWPLGAVNYSVVEGGLLPLLGIEMVAGRTFASDLEASDPDEVVVNQALAERFWPGRNPLGEGLRIRGHDGGVRAAVVVGVAETVTYRTPGEPPTPFFYLPSGQWPDAERILHVRVWDGDPCPDRVERLRDLVRTTAPQVPAVVRRMDAHRPVSTTVAAILRSLLLGTGLAALAMAAVGIFAVVGYATRARTRELAIRMAVGGSAPRLRRMVVGEAAVTVVVAIGAGLLVATLVARLLSAFLYGLSPLDPATYAATGTGIALAALAAAWVPARAVTGRLDLVPLLRDE